MISKIDILNAGFVCMRDFNIGTRIENYFIIKGSKCKQELMPQLAKPFEYRLSNFEKLHIIFEP